jgi:hypothetical protein
LTNAVSWTVCLSQLGHAIFRIVGDDDGGVMFTPDQYEAYKKKVLPMVGNFLYFNKAS